MAVDVVRRIGLDDGEIIARFEEGRGFVEGPDWLLDRNALYEQYDEAALVEEFDGPDLFAVPQPTEKSLSYYARLRKSSEPSGKVYVGSLAEAPDDVVVHAGVDEEGGTDGLYYYAEDADGD